MRSEGEFEGHLVEVGAEGEQASLAAHRAAVGFRGAVARGSQKVGRLCWELRVRSSAGRDWVGRFTRCSWRHSVGRRDGMDVRGAGGRYVTENGQSARVARRTAATDDRRQTGGKSVCLSRFDCNQNNQTTTRRPEQIGQVDDAAARRGSCRKETKRLGIGWERCERRPRTQQP